MRWVNVYRIGGVTCTSVTYTSFLKAWRARRSVKAYWGVTLPTYLWR